MVVDDERSIADSTAMVLRIKGYEAISTYSGEAAIALAESFRPDIALIDVMMEGMNGIDASLAVLEKSPDCRILLISGRPETAELLKREHEKGNLIDVLAKPIHPQSLLDALAAPPNGQLAN